MLVQIFFEQKSILSWVFFVPVFCILVKYQATNIYSRKKCDYFYAIEGKETNEKYDHKMQVRFRHLSILSLPKIRNVPTCWSPGNLTHKYLFVLTVI